MATPLPEREWVSRCLAGDAAAWETFVGSKRPLLSGSIRNILRRFDADRQPSPVDDLTQEVFASLSKDGAAALRRFQWDCSLDHYLVAIAAYHCIAWLKKERRVASLDRGPEEA